jgi:ornithine cyclodeaminase
MRVLDASVVETLETEPLVEQLRQAFRGGGIVPPRHHHTIRVPGTEDATLLLMPAWQEGRYLGTKIVTVFPGNNARSLSSVAGTYILMSGRTGEPLLVADGRMLTLRRTAAASALAAKYLARQDAHRLLMIGTGALAPHLILAHATVRPIREVAIWGRSPEKAERLARTLSNRYLTVTATRDLAGAVTAADVISCATLSQEPLIRGEWLKPGQHLDLVGGFAPSMREADDEAIDRSRVYVDSPVAIEEAGDIVQPLKSGVLMEQSIAGDLAELTQGRCSGRSFYNQITLFKSVGTALEDLAAAVLLFESTRDEITTLR